MTKTSLKLTVRIFLCVAILAGITGCSSARNFLAYLKFWEPRYQAPTQEEQAAQASAFMSRARPARGNPDSHYRLGVYYQERGRHGEAIEEFTKTIAIDPNHVFAYNGLGIAYDNLKEFEKAREAYRDALRITPADRHAYNNLGYSYILEGDYESAVDVLLEGITVNNNDRRMLNNLAMAYVALGETHLATLQVEKTNKPEMIASALEKIEDQVSNLEKDRMQIAEAPGAIASEDIARATAKNRFAERVARTIKTIKTEKRAKKRAVDLKVAHLKPDFLKLSQADRKRTAEQPADRSNRYVLEIVKTGMAEDTTRSSILAGRQAWF